MEKNRRSSRGIASFSISVIDPPVLGELARPLPFFPAKSYLEAIDTVAAEICGAGDRPSRLFLTPIFVNRASSARIISYCLRSPDAGGVASDLGDDLGDDLGGDLGDACG